MNDYRNAYLKTKKQYWWQMIQSLPSSYNQKRTVKLNYQVLKSMYHARQTTNLTVDFCRWCEGLPYFKVCVEPMKKEDDWVAEMIICADECGEDRFGSG